MTNTRTCFTIFALLGIATAIACGESDPGSEPPEEQTPGLDGQAPPPSTGKDAAATDASVPDADAGPVTYRLAGAARGLRGTGLTLTSGGETITVAAAAPDAGAADAGDGGAGDVPFAFTTRFAAGAAYEVTVGKDPNAPTQTCTVASKGAGTFGAADVNDVLVTCATKSFTVGGTVTGLAAGTTLVLQNNAGDDLSLTTTSAAFPAFTFATSVESAAPYAVTVKTQPAGRLCAVTNDSGTVGAANVTNVTVTCTCNNKILLLGASQAGSSAAYGTALQAAGLVPTLVASATAYAGAPAASDFGAVVIMTGDEYTTDIPMAGQTAIVTASTTSGTGVVTSEWGGAYMPTAGLHQGMLGLQLFTRSSGRVPTQLALTVEPALAAHPVWAGLPASFTTVNAIGGNVGSTLVNGGTLLATCPQCGNIAVAVKEAPGRIVQTGLAMDYTLEGSTSLQTFTNDANTTKLYVNAAKWAARCE